MDIHGIHFLYTFFKKSCKTRELKQFNSSIQCIVGQNKYDDA